MHARALTPSERGDAQAQAHPCDHTLEAALRAATATAVATASLSAAAEPTSALSSTTQSTASQPATAESTSAVAAAWTVPAGGPRVCRKRRPAEPTDPRRVPGAPDAQLNSMLQPRRNVCRLRVPQRRTPTVQL